MLNIEPITVSQINEYIKNMFANDEMLANVFVKGEISNFKHHYTGHMYFTLKDEKSLIKCVMFKTYTTNLNFIPKEGMNVLIFGTISCFERDGIYQLYCKGMQEDGMGALYTKYQELKNTLEKEGLFSKEYKKEIPYMPKVIGVLTSKTGSVIKDIINVSTRRFSNVNLKVYPVPVQGKGAEKDIAKGIKFMNEHKLCDVIIIARGGGSLEDLWPFNEELLARAIFDSEIPIISAVGHETDFTIADFVADLRAPTPSAAAELAVPNIVDIEIQLNTYKDRMRISLNKKLEYMRLKYEKVMSSKVFKEPLFKINEYGIIIDNLVRRMYNILGSKIKDEKIRAGKLISKLDAYSPLKTLERGFCIAQSKDKVIRSIKDINKADNINLKFIDGEIKAKVIE